MPETKNNIDNIDNAENTENTESIENVETTGADTAETLETEIKTEAVTAVDNPENTDGQNQSDAYKSKSKEEQSSFKNSIFGTAVILAVISVVTVFAISVVNALSAPVIEKRLADEKDESIKNLFGWDVYSEVLTGFEIPSPATEVIAVYGNDSKELAGYCVTVEPKGYGGKIIMLVAVNPNITVRDMQILSMSETAGYGTKLEDEVWFREQFISRTPNIKDIRTEPRSGENAIQIIAGATVSSKAFLNGINSALNVAGEIKRQKTQIAETPPTDEIYEIDEIDETATTEEIEKIEETEELPESVVEEEGID